MEISEGVRQLQQVLGITADGVYGPATSAAHIDALETLGLPTGGVPTPPAAATTSQAPMTTTTQPPTSTTSQTAPTTLATTTQPPTTTTEPMPAPVNLEVCVCEDFWGDWMDWTRRPNPRLILKWDDPVEYEDLSHDTWWKIEIRVDDEWHDYHEGWITSDNYCSAPGQGRCLARWMKVANSCITGNDLVVPGSGEILSWTRPCSNVPEGEDLYYERLEWGDTYSFRVRMTSRTDRHADTAPTNVVTVTPMRVPDSPEVLNRCRTSDGSYSLSWGTASGDPIINGGSPLTGFLVRWGPRSAYQPLYEEWVPFGEQSVSESQIVLSIDQDVEVRVHSVSDFGQSGWIQTDVGPGRYGETTFVKHAGALSDFAVLGDCLPDVDA
ncbi:MAG: hypothetical protein CMM60_04910 [Rhodospirillaceae bacterium]|nr:hypothetical protein [Rhodospirillaceae bacterium]